nr:MAG TPA: hypothetical protein [Caudoviricetes sp.]
MRVRVWRHRGAQGAVFGRGRRAGRAYQHGDHWGDIGDNDPISSAH